MLKLKVNGVEITIYTRALKMLVAGEDRELNQYDAEKFNADLDFSEVK